MVHKEWQTNFLDSRDLGCVKQKFRSASAASCGKQGGQVWLAAASHQWLSSVGQHQYLDG